MCTCYGIYCGSYFVGKLTIRHVYIHRQKFNYICQDVPFLKKTETIVFINLICFWFCWIAISIGAIKNLYLLDSAPEFLTYGSEFCWQIEPQFWEKRWIEILNRTWCQKKYNCRRIGISLIKNKFNGQNVMYNIFGL